jgi:deazaflavin-dependent oxidoreductase (nitroreductase family)
LPTPKKNDLKERLARYRQIRLSVIGRKSGRTISIPVWFVLEEENLYLLPVQGSDTQWYQNVLQNPSLRIDARGAEAELRAQPITESKTVKSVIEKFREKHGAGDVKKYYSKLDVAVVGGFAQQIDFAQKIPFLPKKVAEHRSGLRNTNSALTSQSESTALGSRF